MTTLRNSAASTSATEKDYKQPPNTGEFSLEKTQEAALANNTEMWEKFEFSDSPKHDTRFAGDLTHNIQHTSDKSFEDIMESEAKKDTQMKNALKGQNKALLELDSELVQKATDVLKEYITPERFERLNTTLSQRTGNCRLLFENPANPSNVWACMRTADSFGIQEIDIVVDSSMYDKKAAVAQKQGTRTAMGSANWVTIHSHSSTVDAIQSLKEQGYKIYASDLVGAKDIRDIQWPCQQQEGEGEKEANSKVCIVMGNEDRGISQQMRELADETFFLKMVGFAESFNLSVATAITLAHLSAQGEDGPLKRGTLDAHHLNCLRLKWVMNSLAQRKVAKALLKKNGLTLPEVFDKL
eukprot:CAMPEP_0178958110 /NCGR_PEP_ID=MMETSP0789-20121207/11388_1 /TAXON_ID=3005 /ORGANISM="Rhizosolenia setigera, Strain CCMP 1694" /LENGTH=354 /DNA_ID=CAMNT_0020640635 /DNA_START=302 /DNA_END=1366 /DNA_ORIENTATION=-